LALGQAIVSVRESVVALFRYRQTRPQTLKKGKIRPAQYNGGWGTAFCVVKDRYLVTAFHVLNGGQPRNPLDRFIVFVVPANGNAAFHAPVTDFPVERPDLDLAILEIGAFLTSGIHLPAVPVTFSPLLDGAGVLTVGFPAPEIVGLNIDQQGNYAGGQFFLKSHANEGIVSAQYPLGSLLVYELNVGWHHGESGGPVVRLDNPLAAFTVMQQYRNIASPHGIVAGPHRGCTLAAIQQELTQLGATVIK